MLSKGMTLALFGALLFGLLAPMAHASTARVVMVEDFDAIG